MTSYVSVERDGNVAIVTLSRPEKRNAIDARMSALLNHAFVAIDEDPQVSAAVLTGAGDVFCAGADLEAVADGALAEIVDAEPGGFGGLVRLKRNTPVIAAVNGHALAGGFELVLACDLAIAAEDARFGLPEVTRGIIPGAGGLVRLPRQIPPKLAMELVLTGAQLSAQRALELGLLNRVVGKGSVLPEAVLLAHEIARLPRVAARAARAVVEVAADEGASVAWRANKEAWTAVLASEDSREGPRAFAEKRSARWSET